MKAIALVLVVACGHGDSKPAPSPSPVKTEAASPEATKREAPFQLALGEATVIELLDKRLEPVSRPIWKLHRDGKTESGNNKTGTWSGEVTAAVDGTLSWDGKPIAKITEHEIRFEAMGDHVQPPIAVEANTLSVKVWTKERDGEDLTVAVKLGPDGALTVHHKSGPRVQYKIDAADPAVMRTAFLIFGATIKHRLD